jgi:hypothetical protein
MKKTIIALVALTAAASVFAQGTVVFNNRVTGTIFTRVYAPQVATPTVQVVGNTASDTPGGTQTYTGAQLTGSGWSAQLWAAPGAGAAEASLVAGTPITTFRTGTAAGQVAAATATLTGVAADAPLATLQLRVWPATFATWALAEAAWMADNSQTIFIGKSPLFEVDKIGGQANPAPNLINSGKTSFLQSFSLVAHAPIPEPSTFALLGLGALGMMIFRRK